MLVERRAVPEPFVVGDVDEPRGAAAHVLARQIREDRLEAHQRRERSRLARKHHRLGSRRPLRLPQVDLAEPGKEPLERHPLSEGHQMALGVTWRGRAVGQEEPRGVVIARPAVGPQSVIRVTAEHRDSGARGELGDLKRLVELQAQVAAGRGLGPDHEARLGRARERALGELEEGVQDLALVPSRPLDLAWDVSLDQRHRHAAALRRGPQHPLAPEPGECEGEQRSQRGAAATPSPERPPQQRVQDQHPQRHQGHAAEARHLDQRGYPVLRVAGLEPGKSHLARGAQLLDREEAGREHPGEADAGASGEGACEPGSEPGEQRQVGGCREPCRVLEPGDGDRHLGEQRDPVRPDQEEDEPEDVAQPEEPAGLHAGAPARLERPEQRDEAEPCERAEWSREEGDPQKDPR